VVKFFLQIAVDACGDCVGCLRHMYSSIATSRRSTA
jgi:hypothetical protein